MGSWRALGARCLRERAARASLGFLALLTGVVILAPLWPLPSPMALALAPEPSAPVPPWSELGRHHWSAEDYWDLGLFDRTLLAARESIFGDWQTASYLGTDAKGRDVLARVVFGGRVSLTCALAAALVSLVLGVTWGGVAGFLGGRIDECMMRVVDALQSLPLVFLVILLVTVLDDRRAEIAERLALDRLTVFYATIGLVSWLSMARVVRSSVLALRSSAFVEAARALGASTPRILATHVLPNVLPVVVVTLTLTIPSVMLFEAFLSFLGLGVEPPQVSWGLLAADGIEALSPLGSAWWLVLAPALALGGTLFALNVLGDALRDALDPRSVGGRP